MSVDYTPPKPAAQPVTLASLADYDALGDRIIEARGLGLGLSLWSNNGVGSFAEEHRDPRSSPWTDLHARLVKLAHGPAAASEELVVRLPYGQGSGWDG